MLQTKVKASAVTNLTDARYFAAREVNWIGFDLNEGSETFINPKMAAAIKEWVDGVQFVGEFNLASAATIREMAEELALDAVQVGTFIDVETLADLQSPIPVIKEIIIEPDTTPADVTAQLELFQPWAQLFILNFEKNGISWSDIQQRSDFSVAQLRSWCKDFQILISMDFNKNMLKSLLNALHPEGLCVKGDEEEKVGFKSFEELDEIFDWLEESEQF